MLWPTCGITTGCSWLPSLLPPNKQEQGITTNSWPPCQEPLQPPLGSTPGESLHIYHFCTRPLSVQRTKERLYREWWGATGALQRFGNSTRLEAPQLFPCSCLRHPPHLHRVGKVLWPTCKVPAVCSQTPPEPISTLNKRSKQDQQGITIRTFPPKTTLAHQPVPQVPPANLPKPRSTHSLLKATFTRLGQTAILSYSCKQTWNVKQNKRLKNIS